MSWRMEVESEDGSDAKYYTRSRAVVGALCTPTRTPNYMVIRQTPNSKSSLLASNSSKSRTCSFVAKRYRVDLVEFLGLTRERANQFFVKIWGKERN